MTSLKLSINKTAYEGREDSPVWAGRDRVGGGYLTLLSRD